MYEVDFLPAGSEIGPGKSGYSATRLSVESEARHTVVNIDGAFSAQQGAIR
jgi:hypothetical protein